MKKCLVTGCAGFIGSSLARQLIQNGLDVVGIDSFLDYYPRAVKEENLRPIKTNPKFRFIEADIATCDLKPLLAGVDTVFHQAAQAGVRPSWGKNFEVYIRSNIAGTQALLEAVKEANLKKFVYASSSSVYGATTEIPMRETTLPLPLSPYGITKLAAEHLCGTYHKSFGVPTVSLRYFTVYGPGQRPDMAMHKFIRAAQTGKTIDIYGDGWQTRDFTFISDIVAANIGAAEKGTPGAVYNIGGGSRVSLMDVIGIIEKIHGSEIKKNFCDKQRGDMKDTFADTARARAEIGYNPKVGLEEGLSLEYDWLKNADYGLYGG